MISSFPSRDLSPQQSPLPSPIDSNEICDDSSSQSQGSSCASMSSKSDSQFAPEYLSDAYAWIEDIIDRLNDLSRSVRQSGMVQSDGRGEGYIPRDEDGRDLRPEFKSYAHQVVQREIPKASHWLQHRLLDSIIRRWSRLLYRRRHQQKLSGVAQHWETKAPDIVQLDKSRTEGRVIEPADFSVRLEVNALVQSTQVPALSSTYPSVMPGPKPLVVERFSAKNYSQKTRSSIKGSKLDIPRPPRPTLNNNVFECPYCCILCPLEEAGGRIWKSVFMIAKPREPTNAERQGTFNKRSCALYMYIRRLL